MAQIVGDMRVPAQADDHPRKCTLTVLDLAEELRKLFDYYEGLADY